MNAFWIKRRRRPNNRRDYMRLRPWVLQDWDVNKGRPDSQLILLFFRFAQYFLMNSLPGKRLVPFAYKALTSGMLGLELPPSLPVGPRLRLYHPHGIVVNPHSSLGADCHLRHGVTIGNAISLDGSEVGVAQIGNSVELGAGAIVIGDIEVGDGARIGAGAVVVKPVPAGGVVVGNPARLVRQLPTRNEHPGRSSSDHDSEIEP